MGCSFALEEELVRQGYGRIAGVDEAGRGPLAGPVAVAAVILPFDFDTTGLDDSKKLTERKRELLYDRIIEGAVSYAVELVDPLEIDELNILNATFTGMCRAVQALDLQPDFVLVDGNRIKGMELPHRCVVKGDATSYSIAAASVLAKVTRDRMMAQMDLLYPEYQFAKHKGYPTRLHYEMIEKFGPSPIHRRSFRLYDRKISSEIG